MTMTKFSRINTQGRETERQVSETAEEGRQDPCEDR